MKKAFYRISILIVLLLIGIGQSKADGYKVTIETDGNGNVSASPADNIAKGSTVTLTVTPNTGFMLNEIKAYRYTDTERADARRGTGFPR